MFDGWALADHTMAIRDLAPALLALAQTFERANELTNGERSRLSLEIKASPREGSLEILFVLKQAAEATQAVLASDFVISLVTLQTFVLGGDAPGLIQLLRALRGKRPEIVESSAEAITLETQTGKLTVPIEVFKFSNDGLIRSFLEAALKPLSQPGVEKVEFKDGDRRISQVEKSELDHFRANPEASDTVTTSLLHTFLKVRLPKLDGQGKWQFHDGSRPNWYSIQDAAFQKEVANRTRAFRAGDILEVDVEVTSTRTATGGLMTEYVISRVYDQRSYPPVDLGQPPLTPDGKLDES